MSFITSVGSYIAAHSLTISPLTTTEQSEPAIPRYLSSYLSAKITLTGISSTG
jgi:hypothetical protein